MPSLDSISSSSTPPPRKLSRVLGAVLALLLATTTALVSAAGTANATEPALDAAQKTVWIAERQKLRTDLDRVNAEIDALKRDARGVRTDYRLRSRMADAEALARRLTELDARLGADAGRPRGAGDRLNGTPWLPAPAPIAIAGDDPAVLDAKADILIDQSRRLTAQGDALAQRLSQVRGRLELRRRAGHLERDPFSPLEQTRRRPVVESGGARPAAAEASPPPRSPNPADSAGSGPPPAGPAAPPFTGGPAVTGSRSNTPDPRGSIPLSGNPGAGSGGALSSGIAGDPPGSVAAQFSGILDAATLAEIRRLEAPGSGGGSIQAMERALTAVRARAAQLETDGRALRLRAKSNP